MLQGVDPDSVQVEEGLISRGNRAVTDTVCVGVPHDWVQTLTLAGLAAYDVGRRHRSGGVDGIGTLVVIERKERRECCSLSY